MSLLIRKSVLLAKTEFTYGVDAGADGVNNAILIRNASVTPLAQDLVARDVITPYLGNDEQIAATTRVEISFEVELAGAGALGVAPGYGPLLRSCAMLQTIVPDTSVIYTPKSDGFESVTLVYNVDGVQHKLLGCRGTVNLQLDARGLPVYAFNFTGLYADVVDAVVGPVDYTAFQKPFAVNNENTITASLFGQSVVTQSVNLDVANNVVYRNLINNEEVLITDRASVGSINFEMTTVLEYDWFADIKATNKGALSVVHGTTPGNVVEINSLNAQISNPSISDSDGVAMLGLDLTFIPSSAGNDEYQIVIR